jgi:hypothetical protein
VEIFYVMKPFVMGTSNPTVEYLQNKGLLHRLPEILTILTHLDLDAELYFQFHKVLTGTGTDIARSFQVQTS